MLARHDEKMARCGLCGRPVAECSDPERDRFPQMAVCYESMAREEMERQFEEAHDGLWHSGVWNEDQVWLPKRTSATPYRPRDGVQLWISSVDHAPSADFLSRPVAGSFTNGEEALD